MSTYLMPEGMRLSTLEERRQFYTTEFNTERVTAWVQKRPGRTEFAVIIGRHSKIFPEEYRDDADTTVIVDEYENFNDVQKQIMEFLPESVYYDRNVYDENNNKRQELAFDLDPENINCPIHGNLADKMRRGQGLGFCSLELDMVRQQALELHEYLSREFSQLQIVYSGRGFHVHIFDEVAYSLKKKKRREIARDVKRHGFAIDEWVTVGEMRLIRLPYSLHGLVSRVVLPLEKSELVRFDPVHDERCIPQFMLKKPISSF